jgi:hypothetical protein
MSSVALGRLVGARSGDKGGDANIGVFIPEALPDPAAAYEWLVTWLDADRVTQLLPEVRDLRVDLFPMANLRAINIVIRGFLGRGVSENALLDPQAKGLGEQLRARIVDIPEHLLAPLGTDLA